MTILEQIIEKHPLESYIESLCKMEFKPQGIWMELPECPICGHKGCAKFKDEKFYCFSCSGFANNAVAFRALYSNITYKEALDEFKKEMGIKKHEKDEDWTAIRESASKYLIQTLFTCQTKYNFKGKCISPIKYLTDTRKHSGESILYFRVGFNDGNLVEFLKGEFKEDTISASGLTIIPEGCFTFPLTVNGEIKYFRIKDPNKLKRQQMKSENRSKDGVWFNQDIIKSGQEVMLVEGEHDVLSLWDIGFDAAASCGQVSQDHINYLKKFDLPSVYLAFDGDSGGKADTDRIVRGYENSNTFIMQFPAGKDPDDVIRESEDSKQAIEELKKNAVLPSAEMRSIIKQKPEGYFISKRGKDGDEYEIKITNWTGSLEAVIVSMSDDRMRKFKIKKGTYETIVYFPAEVLARAQSLREFLLNSCNETLLFTGTDNDLNCLVQYWSVAYTPKIVKESDCVGEIAEGFISDNVFISNSGEFKPLTNSFLALDELHSIKIVGLVKRGGTKAEIPYFPLTEPIGGIDKFKERAFSLLVKNRNLKMAIGIGWIKAVLWSKMFYEKRRWFPLLMLHGKYSGGKSLAARWLMSMVGLRTVSAEMISEKGTTETAMARKLHYYSSLPVFVDDYRNDEFGQRFHSLFRGIFDRTSPTKALKEETGVRQVEIRGAMLVTGETCPTDTALLSRMISIEITKQEREPKYFKELLQMEPQFACIGLDWLKHRNGGFEAFFAMFERIEDIIVKEIENPREAQVWAVVVASALTEPYFANKEEELIEFTLKIAGKEIVDRRSDELMGKFWETIEVLWNRGKLDSQAFNIDHTDSVIEIHLPSLLAEIKSNPLTRHYEFPNQREVAKILKQEPYIVDHKHIKIDGKTSFRWVVDIKKTPDEIKRMFVEPEPESTDGL